MKESRSIISDALGVNTLACDTGFANFGWGVVRYDRSTQKHRVLEVGVVRTKKSPKKQHVLATEDNFARLREIATVLYRLFEQYSIRAITFEAFSMPMKAGKSTLVKMGYPFGALALLSVFRSAPTVMPTPQQIKKALCGDRAASKEQVEEAVHKAIRHGVAWNSDGIPGMNEIPSAQREHAWDALASYIASLDSDVMRAILA